MRKSFYIPEEFFGVWNDFLKFAKEDKRILSARPKNSKDIGSTGLRVLVDAYVRNMKAIKEAKEKERKQEKEQKVVEDND